MKSATVQKKKNVSVREKEEKRTSNRKSSNSNISKNKNKHHEIKGILMLALGILMLLSFYFVNSIGMFGVFIRDVSLGLFGFPAFLIPPALIAFSIYVIANKNNINLKHILIYSFILFVLASSFIQAMLYRPEHFSNLPPLKSLEMLYLGGAGLTGGGVFGGLICLPFLFVFQKLGTIIILTALILVDIILLTNASIANFLLNLKSLFGRRSAKQQTAKVMDLDDDGPDIIEKDNELSLQFKPKVIDFKIEKNSRELKDKTNTNVKKDASKTNLPKKRFGQARLRN